MRDFFRSLGTTLLVVCLFIYFGRVLINQEKDMRIIDEKEKVQKELLSEAQKKTEELKEEKKKRGTVEFVEEYGREELALIKQGEIKFVIENYN